uniref:Secreted protein n=1 Tax=Streptomyces sp. NBC_00049 TaxID=2903617 RepID=A0AAU2JKI8_9ACTN
MLTTARRGWIPASLAVCAALLAAAAWTWLPAEGHREPPVRRPTAAERDLLHTAEQLLVQDCMRERGFSYWPVPLLPDPQFREFPYVVDDADWARANGYGRLIQRRVDEEAESGPRKRYEAGLSAERREALGVALLGPEPTGLEAETPIGTLTHSDQGCVADSWRRLYGDVRLWYASSELTNQLAGDRAGRVERDPAYGKALAAWSACMTGRGFPARDPLRQREEQLGRTGAAAEAQDVPMATAEAECAGTTGLAATAQDLHRRYSDTIRAENRSAFDAMWRMQLAAGPTARDVVARHSGT